MAGGARKTWFQDFTDKIGEVVDIAKFSIPENDGKDFFVNQFEFAKMKREFKNEKALSVFFRENLSLFLKEIDGGDLVSFQEEFSVKERRAFSPRTARADFLVESTNGKFLIEMKTPQGSHDLFGGIGQILRYKNDLEARGIKISEYFLVTDKYDVSFSEVVAKNKLPISICVLRKDYRLYQRNNAN